MKIKKIPKKLAILFLILGASTIVGFLSFGGMFALIPSLPLAFAAFGLSVAYEGEVYKQNITSAIKKIFNHEHLQRQMIKPLLLEKLLNTEATNAPQFFQDYKNQTLLLHHFEHKSLNKTGQLRKKRIKKTLSDMEKWFAKLMFAAQTETATLYEIDTRAWLNANVDRTEFVQRFQKRQRMFFYAKLLTAVAAGFMILSTTYLLMEAYSVIPLLTLLPIATLPFIILPMAIISGVAYGLLSYNAITDMITNETTLRWYQRIKNESSLVRKVLLGTAALGLAILTLALTICTAGTWWTIATQTRPLFKWLAKIPVYITGIINPIITGITTFVFNLQNSSETLELIDECTQSPISLSTFLYDASLIICRKLYNLPNTENWLQILNPFRILLIITITPLRIIFFIGHLLGIAVTSDRVPGVSEFFSAFLAGLSEGFEDTHRFVDELNHKHDLNSLLENRLSTKSAHHHDVDLPTQILHLVLSPVYMLAILWDYAASQLNEEGEAIYHRPMKLNLMDAFYRQTGWKKEENVALQSCADNCGVNHANHNVQNIEFASPDWQKEKILYRIDKHKKTLRQAWFAQEIAREKVTLLDELELNLRNTNANYILSCGEQHATDQAQENYNKHRLFNCGQTTSTVEFLNNEFNPDSMLGA